MRNEYPHRIYLKDATYSWIKVNYYEKEIILQQAMFERLSKFWSQKLITILELNENGKGNITNFGKSEHTKSNREWLLQRDITSNFRIFAHRFPTVLAQQRLQKCNPPRECIFFATNISRLCQQSVSNFVWEMEKYPRERATIINSVAEYQKGSRNLRAPGFPREKLARHVISFIARRGRRRASLSVKFSQRSLDEIDVMILHSSLCYVSHERLPFVLMIRERDQFGNACNF